MASAKLVKLFWGKARPLPEVARPWHPLLWHGLDVAAVGVVLLRRRPDLAARLEALLGWDRAVLLRQAPMLLALHDIGKLTRPFQAKVPELWPTPALGPLPTDPPRDPGHGATGLRLLATLDECRAGGLLEGWLPSEADRLLGSFLGHHGRPVACENGLSDLELFGRDRGALDIAAAYVELLRGLFEVDVMPLAKEPIEPATWPLAGLAILADWIGSRQAWFPYREPDIEPGTYWREHALPQAEDAVRQAGVEPTTVRPFHSFAALAGAERQPSPLQAWAAQVDLPTGPLLILVEDVTGSGKTEAAMALAQRLMAAGRAVGLVMALPTMATANAMFTRMGALYRRLFVEGTKPSLALAHGGAKLHEGFRAAAAIAGQAPAGDAERRGDASAAECAAWLADDRRKAFLADVGVATIDQAILAILPAKHQPIRLLGLAERVLVVDEAHAYDAYVLTELEKLLAAHAAQGGSAIVLSATLSADTRQKLAAAFAGALGRPAPSLTGMAYPMATIVGQSGAAETPLEVRADLVRRVRVERLADADAALSAVAEAAGRGAAVAWVRNTVDDALDAADKVRALGLEAVLFHARFAMGDRLEIEAKVMARFGAGATAEQRRGVLIATQVVEQSLDLDFDLVVSDLAPVDLLLQRMGRLWRHPMRNASRPIDGPRLLVVSPEPIDAPPVDWVAGALPGTSVVYPEHALLWRSARALLRRGEVRVPDDVRALVEEAYDPTAEAPDALAGATDRVRGKESAQTWVARTNTLDLAQGYTPGSGQWAAEHQVPTRDAEDYVTFRLGKIERGRIVPWCVDPDPSRAWALSEAKLRRTRATTAPLPPTLPASLVEQTRATWPEYERTLPLLVLEKADLGDAWRGSLATRRGASVAVTYCTHQGLRFST